MNVNAQWFYNDKLKKQADIILLRQISFCKLNLDNDIDTITNVKHTLYSDTIQGHDGCDGILTGPPGPSGGQKRSKANKDQEDNLS